MPNFAIAQGYPQAGLAAHYTFDRDGSDRSGTSPDFDLRNVEFMDSALYLDGSYEYDRDGTGNRTIGRTPSIGFETFSIVIRFKLATPRQGARMPNLITGGTSGRWFGIRFSGTEGDKLIVYFNNGSHAQRIEGTRIRPNEWTVVACTVDIPNRRVVVYRDGNVVGTVTLPSDFVYDARGNDKEWSFTNYSNGTGYHGWIDDLVVYGTVLTAREVAQLSRRSR